MKGAGAYLVLSSVGISKFDCTDNPSSVILSLSQCPRTPASTSGFVHCFFIKRDTSSPVGMCIPPLSCVPRIITRGLSLCSSYPQFSPAPLPAGVSWLMSGLSSQQASVPNLQPRSHPFLERAFVWGAHGLTCHRVGTAPQTLCPLGVRMLLAPSWGHGRSLFSWLTG